MPGNDMLCRSVIFLLLLAALRAAALELPVLTAKDALALTSEQAKQRHTPALITGVVTYVEATRGWAYVQDATAGILVVPPSGVKVAPGRKVTAAGRLDGGAYAPFVQAALLTDQGPAEYPAPLRTTLEAVAENRHFGQWVEIEGHVVDFGVDERGAGHAVLRGGRTVWVVFATGGAPLLRPELKDALVRVRGVNWSNNGPLLYSPDAAHLEVMQPGRPDAFSAPLVRAADLLQEPLPQHRIRLRATMTMAAYGEAPAFVSEGTGLIAHGTLTLRVPARAVPAPGNPLVQPGDEVELTGYPALTEGQLELRAGDAKLLRKSNPPAPESAALREAVAGQWNYRLVTTRGRLVATRTLKQGGFVRTVLTLEDDGTLMEASLPLDAGAEVLSKLEKDYLIEVTGVVFPPLAGGGPRRLLLRSRDDARQVRLAPSAATRRFLEIGGIVLAAGLGLLGWVVALRRKVRVQRSEQQSLRASEEKFRLLFERSGDAILLLDGGLFQFTDCNEATVRMLRAKDKTEVCRTHPAQLSPELQPDGRTSYEKANEMMETVVREGSHRFEWMHRRMDGEEFLVEVLLTTVQFGEHPLIVTVWREIGERKRAEAAILELNATLEQRVADRTAELARTGEELRKALDAERDLSRLKSNFVSMVSHEFRTPLGIISVSSELLTRYRDRLKPEQRDEHLTAITSATKRMAGMMENILVLSRVDTNRLEFNPSPVNLPALCRQLVDEMHSITDSSCPIEFTAGPGTEGEARADESILRHILPNLLSNACKYSPGGTPVEFTLTREGHDAVFTISDRGIGIPESDQEKLFQSFHRGANVGQTPGTGLGLVIVKRCADLHGGTVSVTSAPGEGTSFKVTLPLYP